MEEHIFVKAKGHWFRLLEEQEDEFNKLLDSLIMTGNQKFYKIFLDFKINCTPQEYKKNTNLNQ